MELAVAEGLAVPAAGGLERRAAVCPVAISGYTPGLPACRRRPSPVKSSHAEPSGGLSACLASALSVSLPWRRPGDRPQCVHAMPGQALSSRPSGGLLRGIRTT